ncbi:hypothetical protein O4H49_04415 [Kiloniella laminariae]|uniref:Uncharacterized protein n=1 Tax=Kiloniella laminariae TaxID=454162 RepID=A0ABT4LFX8_9PROT|nr:hypothetical protein [Kiloniella laminariae]MCZ4280009.1 hypothetical protein [Kiloniella laminariae]
MTQRTLQASFVRGEITPRLHGREDTQLYQSGLAICENWIVLPHGGLTRRPGTRFVATAKHADKQCRLITFEYSTEDAYTIEVGDLYMRFYRDFGQIQKNDAPYEIVTPYTEAQLFELVVTQTENSLWIVHKDHPPKELKRNDHDDWVISDIVFTAKPAEWKAGNYPRRCSFYQQRSIFASPPDQPQTIWTSKTSDEKNLTLGTNADDGFKATIKAGQVNHIQWMVEGRALMMGTSGATRTLSGASGGEALTVTSVINRRHTTEGSAAITPIQKGEVALFLSRNRKRLHEFVFSFERDSFIAPDLTFLSQHITGPGIKAMDMENDPDAIIWMVRDDGQLVGVTYEKSQEVVAFHRHKLGGKTDEHPWGEAESVAVTYEAKREVLWLSVKRKVNGAVVRHIEYMEAVFNDNAVKEDAFFVDCGGTYSGELAGTITGFSHLVGETLDILHDGKVSPQATVLGDGSVTLPNKRKGVKITAGLPYASLIQPLSPIVATQNGTGRGKKKRVVSMGVDVMNTGTLEAGENPEEAQNYIFRDGSTPFGQSPELYTGYLEIDPDNGFNDKAQIYIRASQPLPATIRSLITEVQSEG